MRVDVRVLAATHRDLSARVRQGGFRDDLFYRLSIVPIHLAPLRQRLADILPLAEHFLGLASTPAKHLNSEAAACLIAYHWPGNVRELKNAIERVVIFCRDDTIAAANFDFLFAERGESSITAPDWTTGPLPAAVARLERYMIERALRECAGNRSDAARRLGIHRQLLYSKAEKYGLNAEEVANQGEGDNAAKFHDIRPLPDC
jgi:DNA-binding NtrC family response regulator